MRKLALTVVLLALATPALAQQPSPAEQVQALQVELSQARRDGTELATALARSQTALAASQAENDKLKAAQAAPASKPNTGALAKP